MHLVKCRVKILVDGVVVSDSLGSGVLGGREYSGCLSAGASEFVYLCLSCQNAVVNASQFVSTVGNPVGITC